MKLNCKQCGAEFELRNAEYNRQIKKGRAENHFFCEQTCATKYSNAHRNKKLSEKQIKHIEYMRSVNEKCKKISDPSDYRFFNYTLSLCKRRTRDRNRSGRSHDFDIDSKYLQKLWYEQDGKCAVSGITLKLKHRVDEETNNPFIASIDRIDNSKGYIKGNVRFVCLMANYALSTFSDQDLLNFCKSVVEYNNGLSC